MASGFSPAKMIIFTSRVIFQTVVEFPRVYTRLSPSVQNSGFRCLRVIFRIEPLFSKIIVFTYKYMYFNQVLLTSNYFCRAGLLLNAAAVGLTVALM
jgi:hypothetical protein